MGGNGMIYHGKANFPISDIVSTQININPLIGYFIADRFAIGLFGTYDFVSEKYENGNKATYSNFGFGPFIRYYILPVESRVNILFEGNGGFNKQGSSSTSSKSNFIYYNFLAGPVIFLNSSVGLEFLIGYKGFNDNESNTRKSSINFSIGFQYHLEKEN